MSFFNSSMNHTSRSPINNSKAKALFSFPNAPRFPKNQVPYCDNPSYDLPSTKAGRATSLGFGKRFGDLINKSEAPSPEKYRIDSLDFTSKLKGFQFGMSRDKFTKVYIKEHPPLDVTIPGPGSYDAKNAFIEKNTGSFTLRPKTNFQSIFNDATKNNPGPGAYDGNRAMDSINGRTVYSRFKSPGGAIISRTGQRFDNSLDRRSAFEPGPGAYQQIESVNKTGTFFFNKYKNTGAPVFGKSRRLVQLDDSATRKITPGPGTYRVQSEFGFYNPTEINNETSFFNQSQRVNFNKNATQGVSGGLFNKSMIEISKNSVTDQWNN
eukprot:403349183